MNLQGEIRQLIKEAERQGFRYELLGSGHHRFYAPDHKTIVQCSASTRDGGWKHKFLRELEKAGFVSDAQRKEQRKMNSNGNEHATTSLGDALTATMMPKEEPKTDPPRGTYINIARDLLNTHPDRWHTAHDLGAVIRARGYAAYTDVQAGIVLANLRTQGEAERGDTGHYRKPHPRPAPAAPAPAPVIDMALDASDDDIAELDSALVALGRIETVVRKYKGLVQQIRAVKTALAGVK